MLDGPVRTSLYLALSGSLSNPTPAFTTSRRQTPDDANLADVGLPQRREDLDEFTLVSPELRPVKGAQNARREAVDDP